MGPWGSAYSTVEPEDSSPLVDAVPPSPGASEADASEEDVSALPFAVASAGLAEGFVPWIVMEPMPDDFELKDCWVPFLVTVAAVVSLTCTVIDSVTTKLFSQGPVTCSAMTLVPSLSISSQGVAPSATLTSTLV